jgi:hypothetical protein
LKGLAKKRLPPCKELLNGSMATSLVLDAMTIEEKLQAMEAPWAIVANMKRPGRFTNGGKNCLTSVKDRSLNSLTGKNPRVA